MSSEQIRLGEHEARIGALEERADLERSELREDLQRINDKLELVLKFQAANPPNPCPSPGACIELGQRIQALEAWRTFIVGGSVVAWAGLMGIGYLLWEWAKAGISAASK